MIKKLNLVILLVIFSGMGSATIISQESVSVDLQDNSVDVQAEIETLTQESFNWRTAHPVSDLKAEINNNKKECTVEKLAVGSLIECSTDLKENFSVSLNYKTGEMVSTKGDAKFFRYSQSIYRPINNYTFRVILPEGTGVLDSNKSTRDVISPDTGKVKNVDGRRFAVEWNTNPNLKQAETFSVIYQPLTGKETPSVISGGFLAAVLVILLALLVYKRKKEVKTKKSFENLKEDERKVVKMVKEEGGEMLQKDIVDETDYSKAKISGVVSKLEEEGMVSKEKEGRSNKVTLNRKFRN